MRVIQEKATITGDLTFSERVGMQFDPSAMAMQVRNAIRMYANPRLAALREYTSNARDAHKAAGYQGAVEVTLPTSLHPFLTVVDHGIGLTREEVKGFGQFGRSTKADSDEYIGGFGLGSKSGLAVAQQFTVIAVKNGKKNVAVVGWDETGLPSLGFLDEQTTTEGNGVTIQIPSATGHNDWATIASGLMFVGWEPGSIVINGKAPEKSVHNPAQFRPISGGWLTLQERGGNRYYYGPDHIDALVHGVYYKVPTEKLGDRTFAKVLDGSVLNIANGSVDILPSRDDLEWTDRTTKAVRAAARVMVDAVVAEYAAQIKDAKTFKDAKKVTDAMEEIGLPTRGLTHNGILLDWTAESDHPVTRGIIKTSTSAKSGWQTDRAATATKNAPDVHKVHAVLVYGCDGQTVSAYKKKDQAFINQSSSTVPFIIAESVRASVVGERIYVYYTNEDKDALPKGFVAAMSRVIHASTFEAEAAEQRKVWAKERATAVAAGTVPKVDRMLRTVTGFNNWAYSFSVRERSEQGIIASGDNVVVLHADDALARRVMDLHTNGTGGSGLKFLMTLISNARNDTVFVLLAKNHKASNLSITGWKNLTDWTREQLSALPTLTPMQVAVANYRRNRPHYSTIPKTTEAEAALISNPKMREWMEAYIAPDKSTNLLNEVANILPELAPSQPQPEAFTPWDQYPLIPHMSLGAGETHLLVDYINLVDSTR